jgi:hypothetical protein
MRIDLTGRSSAIRAMTRAGLLAVMLVSGVVLSACTTTEGTNAMGDFGTFEREVMTETLVGLGGIPREQKEEPKTPRAPLVMPKDSKSLPAPTNETKIAELPEDSSKVQIDTTGMSEADLSRLRNARVVDLRTISGRPLTDAEAKMLTARMTAARLTPGARPLYLPPEEYFTTVSGTDMVCATKSGDLVPLDHKDCPKEIREAMKRAPVQGGGSTDAGLGSQGRLGTDFTKPEQAN